jgi:hypothetical protein
VYLTGANSDALVVFDPRSERFSIFRAPYPLVMYHRGIDGGSTILDPAGTVGACGSMTATIRRGSSSTERESSVISRCHRIRRRTETSVSSSRSGSCGAFRFDLPACE